MHLIVRVDGGPEIGFGHLVRTSTIAREVIDHGGQVTCATTTLESARKVFPDDTEVRLLSSRTSPDPFIQVIDDEQPDAVLIDAYPVGLGYQQKVRQQAPLAVFTADARRSICADILINGNLYANDLTYDFVGSSPKQLLGPKYVPLQKQIRLLANRCPPWRNSPQRALITLGGSDIENKTPTVIRAFDKTSLHVDAIVGPGYSGEQESEIRAVADDVSANVSVARDPDDLAERMFQADFAVSTTGSTIYELLALGTPIITYPVVGNQKPIAVALSQHDLATVLHKGFKETPLQETIDKYIIENTIRWEYRNNGRELVDAKGVKRIRSHLLNVSSN